VLRHAGHPAPEVRREVAAALGALAAGDRPQPEGIGALIVLGRDGDDRVRERAVAALARLDADTSAVREALAERLGDVVPTISAEAALGLAKRQDGRAVETLAGLLADGKPDGVARETAVEAVGLIGDEGVRGWLGGVVPRCR
ncbi:HEAT repeat domain-containing protein, partial [Streptomyces sp. NPDC055078]